ncbi:hypothetical protein HDV02_004022 [Globomyces sp. JEL0801]|nr:hypothetical protein HDV02_004022 [Globomyces sp. JEL0801]
MSQPLGGWFQAILSGNPAVDNITIAQFNNLQKRHWAYVGYDASVDPALLGTKVKLPTVNPLQLSNPNFTIKTTQGLLGSIPSIYFLDNESFDQDSLDGIKFQPIPWYNVTDSNTSDKLDDMIGNAIQKTLNDVGQLDKSNITSSNVTLQTLNLLKISKSLQELPYGALYFNKIDHKSRKYSWNYHFGNDKRLSASTNFPASGPRLLYQQAMLDNAILANSENKKLRSAKITQGLRIMPQVGSNKLDIAFGSLIGSILYPFGVSFLIPIFVISLVQEKERRILVMMRMNGMKSWPYYLSHYVVMLILYCISALVFLITGYCFKLTFFTITPPSVLVIAMFIWGNVQIALAFFFATLFNKSRTALVVVFMIVLCSVIISLVTQQLYEDRTAPFAYLLWPPFAFYRILGLMNVASYDPSLLPFRISDLFGTSEASVITYTLIAEVFVFFGLSFYLDAIFPSEFGVTKPWHFPITDLFKAKHKKLSQEEQVKQNASVALDIDSNEIKFEDDDVREERARVLSPDFKEDDHLLVINRMRKVYPGRGGAGPKLAVKDVTFAVERGITFGLLGPNGAGKSTLISILTGLYNASAGSAKLAGFDIVTETADVYRSIGICPQFDILWDELTISEHLYFYARLKGIVAADEKRAVDTAMKQVSLFNFANRLTRGLSGGEKRRLSIAIALLGAPTVVFLDEPTTGLDPEVRRLIWNIVNEARLDKTVILTTHSMEEAEALCQRIGIMAKGTLRCLAEPTRLKELYGSGFKIYSNSLAENTPQVAKFIEENLPAGWTQIDNYATNIAYEFPGAPGAVARIFEVMEANKERIGILDYGIGQTTLEEVFVKLITEADASAEY